MRLTLLTQDSSTMPFKIVLEADKCTSALRLISMYKRGFDYKIPLDVRIEGKWL